MLSSSCTCTIGDVVRGCLFAEGKTLVVDVHGGTPESTRTAWSNRPTSAGGMPQPPAMVGEYSKAILLQTYASYAVRLNDTRELADEAHDGDDDHMVFEGSDDDDEDEEDDRGSRWSMTVQGMVDMLRHVDILRTHTACDDLGRPSPHMRKALCARKLLEGTVLALSDDDDDNDDDGDGEGYHNNGSIDPTVSAGIGTVESIADGIADEDLTLPVSFAAFYDTLLKITRVVYLEEFQMSAALAFDALLHEVVVPLHTWRCVHHKVPCRYDVMLTSLLHAYGPNLWRCFVAYASPLEQGNNRPFGPLKLSYPEDAQMVEYELCKQIMFGLWPEELVIPAHGSTVTVKVSYHHQRNGAPGGSGGGGGGGLLSNDVIQSNSFISSTSSSSYRSTSSDSGAGCMGTQNQSAVHRSSALLQRSVPVIHLPESRLQQMLQDFAILPDLITKKELSKILRHIKIARAQKQNFSAVTATSTSTATSTTAPADAHRGRQTMMMVPLAPFSPVAPHTPGRSSSGTRVGGGGGRRGSVVDRPTISSALHHRRTDDSHLVNADHPNKGNKRISISSSSNNNMVGTNRRGSVPFHSGVVSSTSTAASTSASRSAPLTLRGVEVYPVTRSTSPVASSTASPKRRDGNKPAALVSQNTTNARGGGGGGGGSNSRGALVVTGLSYCEWVDVLAQVAIEGIEGKEAIRRLYPSDFSRVVALLSIWGLADPARLEEAKSLHSLCFEEESALKA